MVKETLTSEEVAKRFQNLNLSDNFLFGEAMLDEEVCKTVLEIILERKVYRIVNLSKEKHMDVTGYHKGVRFDVYFEDERETAYSVEMQNRNQYNLPRRSRHYQSVIDVKLLPAGEVDYNQLKDGIIIFICTFDLFDRGLYRYTFENCCLEELGLRLEDGTRKIFLNTEGTNASDVQPELIEFLRYVKDSIHTMPQTEAVKKISRRVEKVKKNGAVEAEFMMSLVHDNEIRFEAKQEGGTLLLIRIVLKNQKKGMSTLELAELLEVDKEWVERVLEVGKQLGSEDEEEIYQHMMNK